MSHGSYPDFPPCMQFYSLLGFLWTARRKLTFFSSLLGLKGIINYFLGVEIILCSPTVNAKINLEGKQIVHALPGRDSRVQFKLGGLENLHRRCKFVGEVSGASSPRKIWNVEAQKWYFQHSQWDISLKKLNLDKVLNKNTFPLEKLPSPHQPLCRPCMGMDNREWQCSRAPNDCFL